MESWQRVWREGMAPQLGTPVLRHLETALDADDVRLIQGSSTQPPPMVVLLDHPVTGACLLGYCAWCEGRPTVGEVDERLAGLCQVCDGNTGEPGSARHLLNWWDETPRGQAVAAMLAEVRRELARRGEGVAHETRA